MDKFMVFQIFIILCVIITIYYFYRINYQNKFMLSSDKKLNTCFYDYALFPELIKIKPYQNKILDEYKALNAEWIDWPEKQLYNGNSSWKVFPLFAFGKWSKNCEKLPILTQYLNSVSNLKTAGLSKLGPKSKLEPHQGWADHSNNVIRCHFGLQVPDDCLVLVSHDGKTYEQEYQQRGKWIVFDDSKYHYATNNSDQERVVLIVDIERPDFIQKGTSTIEFSDELVGFMTEFNKNKK